MRLNRREEFIDLSDPEFVRLASYLAAAGKTWRDEKGLHTLIRSQFRPVVYPLFRKFYPKVRCPMIGTNKIVRDRSVTDLAFRVDDQQVLKHLEEAGFYLGSKRRKPNPYVVNNANLFAVYLRVVWEVHGEVREHDGTITVALVQKFPQELLQLKLLLIFGEVESVMVNDGKDYILEIDDPQAVKNFFGLMRWEPDWKFGEKKLNRVYEYYKRD